MTHENQPMSLQDAATRKVVGILRQANKLEAMMGGISPQILMTEPQLDSFLLLPFGDDDVPAMQVVENSSYRYQSKADELSAWLNKGISCEETVPTEDGKAKCPNDAIAAVGWFSTMMAEEVMACRDHIRTAHARIVTEGMLREGFEHKVTINGRILPQWDRALKSDNAEKEA